LCQIINIDYFNQLFYIDKNGTVYMRIVIIGNGIAATSAAVSIREYDTENGITMLSDEHAPFYSRPRLTEYLAGKVAFEKIVIRDETWYAKNNIELMQGVRVESVDPGHRAVTGSFGLLNYDRLLIASGASAALPSFYNSHLEHVFTLRTKEDADRIAAVAARSRTAVIIGGGLLGIETAYALAERGLEPTVIEVFDRLLPRQLDAESANMLQDMLEQKGLHFLLAQQTASLSDEYGMVKISFKDDSALSADMAVISAGIRPNISFLKNSQVEVGHGIIVDTRLRTNIPDIYAAGDCAEFKGKIYGIWPAAKEEGEIAGKVIAGQEASYHGSLMSAKLKVASIDMASVGDITIGSQTRAESRRDGSSFRKLFYENEKLKGAILIGDTTDYFKLQREIAQSAG
jgi:nitrite reductase (NADH) large subunit